MINAWIGMWKNIFNYKNSATRKEFWQAVIINIIAMYVGIIPYALILKLLNVNYIFAITIYLIVFLLPTLSICIRRANDVGLKIVTTLYYYFSAPIISILIMGFIPSDTAQLSNKNITFKLLSLGYGLNFYGSFISILLFDSPNKLPFFNIIGLLIIILAFVCGGSKGFLKK